MGLENPLHIAFLLIVLLLVFGAKRLPEMGRSLGSGLREFKTGVMGATAAEPTARQTAAPLTTDTAAPPHTTNVVSR